MRNDAKQQESVVFSPCMVTRPTTICWLGPAWSELQSFVQYRLEEVFISAGSPLEGQTIDQASIRDRTGALVVAILNPGGELLTNPPPETELTAGVTLIAMGTDEQLGALVSHSGSEVPLNRMPRSNS